MSPVHYVPHLTGAPRDPSVQDALQFLRESHGVWPLIVLFLAAAMEYVFPPVPGDTMVLSGALVIVAGVWPFSVVLAAVVAGGTVGVCFQYALGRWLRDSEGNLRGGRWLERLIGRGNLGDFFGMFRRYSLWVFVFNRAIPGVRAVAFLAAGAAEIPFPRALACGFVANLGWSAMLLTLGVTIGDNWSELEAWAKVYNEVIVGVIVVAILAVGIRWFRRRNRPKPDPIEVPPTTPPSPTPVEEFHGGPDSSGGSFE